MKNVDTKADFTHEDEGIGRKQPGGPPVNAFFIPIAVVLAILNIAVIVNMYSIFSTSGRLSQLTQDSSTYITDATSLLGGTSLLSETASNYVLMPVTSKGEPNVGPLIAYVGEMDQTDHRGYSVLARFETYQVSDDVLQNMRIAAESADALVDMQKRAIALVSSVYSLPDTPALAGLDLPALSVEDAALSDQAKVELAQTLVLDTEYGTLKGAVSSNVNAAVGSIRASTGEQVAVASSSIATLRTTLIAIATIMIAVLCLAFFLLYRLIVAPLGKFSHLILEGKPLDDKKGLREMRLLAGSYNDLLQRRDALEGVLREAAETDALTGLPNRFSLQQDLLDAAGKGYSLTVVLFDVNNLKATNDTLGHTAGDDLLRRSARCISTCFASTADGKCYRLAGDEFAAVIRNYDEDQFAVLVPQFEELQKQNDVSISWGHAYAREIGETSFRSLIDEADRQMYLMKEEAHRNNRQPSSHE